MYMYATDGCRAEALPLAVQLYKCFGASIRKPYECLRPVQLKDFDAAVADLRESRCVSFVKRGYLHITSDMDILYYLYARMSMNQPQPNTCNWYRLMNPASTA